MRVNAYLSFNGDCEAAFTFYVQSLGARLGTMFRYAGTPLAATVPAEWARKIMHGSVTLGDLVLMGADVAPEQYEPPKGFSLLLHVETADEADRIFERLSEGGRVVVAAEQTFWAARFAAVIDRFGVPWSINGGEATGGS